MFHIRPEGKPLKNGFNFYPLSEWSSSRGFVWRWNGYKRQFRYSVKQGRWLLDARHDWLHQFAKESSILEQEVGIGSAASMKYHLTLYKHNTDLVFMLRVPADYSALEDNIEVIHDGHVKTRRNAELDTLQAQFKRFLTEGKIYEH